MASWLVPGFTVGEVRIQGENMRITEVGRYQGIVLGNYSTLQFVVSNFTAHDLGDYSISVRNSVAETTVLHEVTGQTASARGAAGRAGLGEGVFGGLAATPSVAASPSLRRVPHRCHAAALRRMPWCCRD